MQSDSKLKTLSRNKTLGGSAPKGLMQQANQMNMNQTSRLTNLNGGLQPKKKSPKEVLNNTSNVPIQSLRQNQIQN